MAFVRTVAFGVGLLSAIGASQLPEFAQQYMQRLGGAVDELGLQIARFDVDARRNGLDAPQAIRRLKDNPDPVVQARGVAAEVMIARHERLEPHYRSMLQSGGVERAMALLSADAEIARRAFQDYRPAVPVTMDGAWTAALGFAAGVLAVFGLSATGKRVTRTLRKRKVDGSPVS